MHDRDPLFPGPVGFPLAFGTWAIGETDWGPMPGRDAKRLLRRAWELGFRHFDTAETYGNGRAEQLIGQEFRNELRGKREKIIVADKSVVRPPHALEKHLVRSLRRLGTEYIDLFYIHWPRAGISLLDAVEELNRHVDAGRVRAVGLSNVDITEYTTVTSHFPVAAVQAGHNMLWRAPEHELWPRVTGRRVAYSPLAQGVLARAFLRSPRWDPHDHRQKTPLFSAPVWDAVHRFNTFMMNACRTRGIEPSAVALIWLLASPPGERARADAAIVGGRTPDQLERVVSGLESSRTSHRSTLYRELLAELDAFYGEIERSIPELPNPFGYVPKPVQSNDNS